MTHANNNIWRTADFNGFKVTVHLYAGRFVISWDWTEATESNEGFLAFRDALAHLEESTNYRQQSGDHSLFGDLCSDTEDAHIFVAFNLTQLERYAAGDSAVFLAAQDIPFPVLRAAYGHGKEVR